MKISLKDRKHSYYAAAGKVLWQQNGVVTLQLGHPSIDLASGGYQQQKKKIDIFQFHFNIF